MTMPLPPRKLDSHDEFYEGVSHFLWHRCLNLWEQQFALAYSEGMLAVTRIPLDAPLESMNTVRFAHDDVPLPQCLAAFEEDLREQSAHVPSGERPPQKRPKGRSVRVLILTDEELAAYWRRRPKARFVPPARGENCP